MFAPLLTKLFAVLDYINNLRFFWVFVEISTLCMMGRIVLDTPVTMGPLQGLQILNDLQ